MAAHEAGVPWWRDWEIGDAHDIGVCVTMGLWMLLRSYDKRTARAPLSGSSSASTEGEG